MSSTQQPSPTSQAHDGNAFSPDTPFDFDAFMIQNSRPSSAVPDNVAALSNASMTPEALRSSPTSTAQFSHEGTTKRKDSTSGQIKSEPGSNDNQDGKGDQPAWAEMKTKAGKDRKRLPLACIACRRKKIRCSGEKPACKHCLKSRIPCVYKVTTRKAAPRTDYMAMLDKRLKRMEERVIKIIPKGEGEQVQIPNVTRAIVKPNLAPQQQQQQQSNISKKRTADEAFSSELEEWANRPSSAMRPPSRALSTSAGEDAEEKSLLNEGRDHLPSLEIQEHLIEVFFDYCYGQSYYVLHKPSFMRKFAAKKIPPILTLSMCALAARFSNHPSIRTDPPFLRGEHWAKVAREIALQRFDSPNITILIVFLLLGLHDFGSCQGGRSWMLGGMAHRMAYALQLHKDLDHDPHGKTKGDGSQLSFTDREIRRRVMWACFMMDRFNSSGTNRPMFASEQYMHLQLPVREDLFQKEIPGATENIEGNVSEATASGMRQSSQLREDLRANMGVPAFTIRLVALWGRMVKFMNLGGREKEAMPIWSPHSSFKRLQEDIDAFKNDLPQNLQYTKENLQTHAADNMSAQFLFMHIAYWQCVLFIHRFAYPAIAKEGLKNDMPFQFLSTSRSVALNAATEISELLEEALNHRCVVAFVGYCTYMSSGVHIDGIFSNNKQLQSVSKKHLATNVRYMSKMKKFWGMFHFLTESLKDQYHQYSEAANKGDLASNNLKRALQYGDWFDRYPHGVLKTDYEEPVENNKDGGEDAVLSQKSDFQTVEEFFATLSPLPPAGQQNSKSKGNRRSKNPRVMPAPQHQTPASDSPVGFQPNPPFPNAASASSLDQLAPGGMTAGQFGLPESYDRSPIQPGPLTPSSLQQQQQQPAQLAPFNFEPTNQLGMMSQLDHQLVLASYNGVDPAAAAQGLSGNLWDMDLTGFGADGFIDPALNNSAWFMPFNLDPPDLAGGSEASPLVGGGGGGRDAPAGTGFQDFWFPPSTGQGQEGGGAQAGRGMGNG